MALVLMLFCSWFSVIVGVVAVDATAVFDGVDVVVVVFIVVQKQVAIVGVLVLVLLLLLCLMGLILVFLLLLVLVLCLLLLLLLLLLLWFQKKKEVQQNFDMQKDVTVKMKIFMIFKKLFENPTGLLTLCGATLINMFIPYRSKLEHWSSSVTSTNDIYRQGWGEFE
jgi:hypothetical protein